jgi:hypothetical protein
MIARCRRPRSELSVEDGVYFGGGDVEHERVVARVPEKASTPPL